MWLRSTSKSGWISVLCKFSLICTYLLCNCDTQHNSRNLSQQWDWDPLITQESQTESRLSSISPAPLGPQNSSLAMGNRRCRMTQRTSMNWMGCLVVRRRGRPGWEGGNGILWHSMTTREAKPWTELGKGPGEWCTNNNCILLDLTRQKNMLILLSHPFFFIFCFSLSSGKWASNNY